MTGNVLAGMTILGILLGLVAALAVESRRRYRKAEARIDQIQRAAAEVTQLETLYSLPTQDPSEGAR